ncbi:MAG: right-handed parallel beta-helix repeat-containing protein [candidate division KSB1 bacterium]|nr:right-handed parallel beta-helix repeat-containing protein [candidate division KSB1 bacterium]
MATDGNDANPGTLARPFQTISRAIAEIIPGDTIYVRGGRYALTATIMIPAAKSGTAGQWVTLTAFPNETPLLDFSAQPGGARGISLRASYWHLHGLQIKGAGDNGMEIDGGTNNLIENCAFFENRDSGLQLSNGAADNRISNCDSYYNADPPDYADADGFAPKLTVGSGNVFQGCRAWGNADDGWDGYLRGADNVSTILENCWTWGNGYLKDGTDPGPQANGNGFKLGGGDNSNSGQLRHHVVLINCLAFNNKQKGFDQNNNAGSMTLLQCTGYNNREANYSLSRALAPGQTLTVKNCVSFAGRVELGSFAVQAANSWMSPFVVTAADFADLDPAPAALPRRADGSLPAMPFLHLAAGSDLIDAGVDLGRPFKGRAPDLGAFESDFGTAVANEKFTPAEFRLHQNHPNPFHSMTMIEYEVPGSAHVKISVYDILGREVMQLMNEAKAAGRYELQFNAQNLPGGIYFCRLAAGSLIQTKKMMVMRSFRAREGPFPRRE